METVLILSADKWALTDEKTGEVRSGVLISFVNDYREDSATEVGFKPIRAPTTAEVFDAIKKHGAPGVYRILTKTRPGALGKPTLSVVMVEFVKLVEIFAEEK